MPCLPRRCLLCVCSLLVSAGLAQTQAVHPKEKARATGEVPEYHRVTASGRLKWFAYNTIGPPSLVTGLFSAGFGTGVDAPSEYGPHWDGFGKRYGMRLTGVSVSNAIEASLGAAWGEDPRYFRAADEPFTRRVRHVVKMTFQAENREGGTMPAYARFLAIPANNFLSNTWRPASEADAGHAVERSLIGVVGRMASNAFQEFVPDVWSRSKQKVARR